MELENLISLNTKLFEQTFTTKPFGVVTCPGRINILGDHTDYLYGQSLPAAINKWTIVTFDHNKQNKFRIKTDTLGDYWEVDSNLDSNIESLNSWQKYVFGALKVFNSLLEENDEHDHLMAGGDLHIWSNIPIGKGLSSSASLELSVLHALSHLSSFALDPYKAVLGAQKIEHQYLGVPSGLLDQIACSYAKKSQMLMVDFSLPEIVYKKCHKNLAEWSWVCIDTNIKRSLASSEYKIRVDECNKALEIISQEDQNVLNFPHISQKHLSYLHNQKKLQKRMKHMLGENERTKKGLQACIAGDVKQLGELLNESHVSLKEFHEVSCPELDFLQSIAIKQNECLGARMMGGGFGGCTLNLVKRQETEHFINKINLEYKNNFGIMSQSYSFSLVDGLKSFVETT